jgi:hypothetical protein
MSDKKVGRFGGRPTTPTEQMERALSDSGTLNMADLPHDKGKAVIADKFREREERWRREQASHDQREAHPVEPAGKTADEAQAGGSAEGEEKGEGGGR